MVRPTQLSAQDRITVANRPVLMDTRKKITCYQYYEITVHVSPECLAKLNNMNLVVRNYEKLTDEQKALVPSDANNLFRKYLEMKRNLATNFCNSDEQPQSGSKNYM